MKSTLYEKATGRVLGHVEGQPAAHIANVTDTRGVFAGEQVCGTTDYIASDPLRVEARPALDVPAAVTGYDASGLPWGTVVTAWDAGGAEVAPDDPGVFRLRADPPFPWIGFDIEDEAARAAIVRAQGIRADCRARIMAVADEPTQANIAQAGVIYATLRADGTDAVTARAEAGVAEGDLAVAAAWKGWVSAMQAECRRAIETGDDPAWPAVPADVPALVARF